MYERRGPRLGLILIIVVIVLLLGGSAIFVLNFLGSGGGGGGEGQPEGQPVVVESNPTTVQIIVAAHDIRRGARLTEEDVTIMNWPVMDDAPLPVDALVVGETSDQPGLEQVADKIARVDILANQPVLGNMLASIDQPVQLAANGSDAALLIPPGKIAIAFPIDRLSSVAYSIKAGDHVDVLISYRLIDLDEDFQTKLPNGVSAFAGGTGFTQSVTSSEEIGVDTEGREVVGPFGLQIMVVPGELDQRPRQSTQLMIGNAQVLGLGEGNPAEPEEEPAPAPVAEGEPTSTPSVSESGGAPLVPDIITLVMSRQDALVLKYSLEVGADIDLVLRSAYDNDVNDIKTESVTLEYLFEFYNLAEPPKLPIGHDPSIDVIINPKGNFQQGIMVPPTPEP